MTVVATQRSSRSGVIWQNAVNSRSKWARNVAGLWLPGGGASANGSAYLYDSSQARNHGALTNSPTYSKESPEGLFGSVAFANNANDYVDCGDVLNISGPKSVLVKFKAAQSQADSFPKVLWKPTVAAAGRATYAFQISKSSQTLIGRVTIGSNNKDVESTTQVIGSSSSNFWYYAALVHDGSTLKLYINGTEEDSVSAAGSSDTATNSLRIGGDTSTSSDDLTGNIAFAAILSRALSARGVIWWGHQIDNSLPLVLNRAPLGKRYFFLGGGGGVSTTTSPVAWNWSPVAPNTSLEVAPSPVLTDWSPVTPIAGIATAASPVLTEWIPITPGLSISRSASPVLWEWLPVTPTIAKSLGINPVEWQWSPVNIQTELANIQTPVGWEWNPTTPSTELTGTITTSPVNWEWGIIQPTLALQQATSPVLWEWIASAPTFIVGIEGPGKFVAGQVYFPGFKQGHTYIPGFKQGEVYRPGFQAGENN